MTISTNHKPVILVTRRLPDQVEARLSADFAPKLNRADTIMDADGLVAAARGCDGILLTATEKMTAEVIQRLPDTIKIMATFSVGYDHVAIPAAQACAIAVTNTPDVLTDATADICLLLMLGAARGAYWGERMVREKTWGTWAPTHPLGHDVSGRRLAIVGMGRIGRAVAKRASAFDMEIHYHNRSKLVCDLEQGAKFHANFHEMLPLSDFLSINCASTPQTRGLINAENIARLPDGAIVINTARGDIVDDDALIHGLKSGKLAAAGLDVFAGEPDIDPRYRELQNVFLLPHLGSATLQTRIAMGMRAVDNLEEFFKGAQPGDLVTS